MDLASRGQAVAWFGKRQGATLRETGMRERPGARGRDSLGVVVAHFERTQWWPGSRLRAAQERALARLLRHAAETVPFYAGRLHNPGLFDAERFDWDAFRAIPPLRRADLQAGSEAFLSRPLAALADPAFSFTTSGSTGMPVTVHWTPEANRLVAAAIWRYHHWYGSDPAAKSCSLRAVPTDVQGRGRVIRSRGWYPGHPEGESVAADAAQPVRAQLRWLVAEAPRYLLTYPSNARALLTEARESGVGLPTLERIDSFGETMVEGLADLARSVCGARVADRYSARETGMLAIQCPQGTGYHVQAESVLLEIVDESGTPVEKGESGRVLVTVLHNA
ncbi:MAG: hypothetical protein D6807_06945, partial [Alphaproteobacteria bacterium]